jgi:ubiquinone/menaquinone biosynthesis C-methylase UbiE
MSNEEKIRAADYDLPLYFDMQAEMGHTKHLGGRKATDILAELCHFGPGQTILYVGSGSGIPAAYLAEKHQCRIVGVDILPGMVSSAQNWAQKKGLADQLEFRVADARDLPFDNNHFDAVISESVNTFIPEREQAMAEYVRVVKPGGYVGMTEGIWIKEPSEELAKIINEAINQELKPTKEWETLFVESGLTELVVQTHPMGFRDEAKNQSSLLSISDYLRIFGKAILWLFKDAETRALIKYAGSNPKQYFEYMGYGIYVGRK